MKLFHELKKGILKLIPTKIKFFIKKRVGLFIPLQKIDNNYKDLKIEEIFTKIYKEDLWGSSKTEENNKSFYSGPGSYNNTAVEYVDLISKFIKSNDINSITDIGCGDFNIGNQICQRMKLIKYTGVDIVPSLIERNVNNYSNDKINFICANALTDKIPVSDLLLIRQVFQHLSNEDILLVIKNIFSRYKYIIITEQQIKKDLLIKKNLNKPSGPGTRISLNSSVFLQDKPFSLRADLLLSVEDENNKKAEINSFLVYLK